MTLQQLDAIVTLAADYKDACVKARFFATHGALGFLYGEKARVTAIEAKHAYDALVAQIARVQAPTCRWTR